jgi:alcohol dehydrogenase class IV
MTVVSETKMPVDAAVAFASAIGGVIALPRRVLLGDNSLDRLGEALKAYATPAGPILLIADAVLEDPGPVARAKSTLLEAGYEPVVHLQAAGEPDLAVAEAVVTTVRSRPYVAVVGLGGGSAMDPAKLAAGLATNEGSAEGYMRGCAIERPALTQVLVPTTAGTGAEASKNTIVTHEGRKFVIGSPLLCADLAVLDPTLTATCPVGVTAASGMDALAHAVEATLSTWATPYTTSHALTAIRAVGQWLPSACRDGANLQARRAMLYAAHFAGLSINASTLLGHSIAYTIATRTHLPHGVTTAMALPYCIAYDAPGAPEQVAAMELALGDGPLAFRVQMLANEVGMPSSLRDIGIDEDELTAMVDEVISMYPRPNNPVPFRRDCLLTLYQHFFEGNLEGASKAMER